MKFLVDENLPASVAELLRMNGHDAATVSGTAGLRGMKDPAVMRMCDREDRILITLDHDFMNPQQYPPEKHPGIIVLHLSSLSKRKALMAVQNVLDFMEREDKTPRHQMWIVAGRFSQNVGVMESFSVLIHDPSAVRHAAPATELA